MDIILESLAQLIVAFIDFYTWIVVASIVLSWLTAYNVVNASNRFVALVADFIYRVTEPVLRRIRKYLPDTGSIDISPVVLIMALWFIQLIVIKAAIKYL